LFIINFPNCVLSFLFQLIAEHFLPISTVVVESCNFRLHPFLNAQM